MADSNEKLNTRQRGTIIILFFIVKLLNPTGYTHEVDALKKQLEEL